MGKEPILLDPPAEPAEELSRLAAEHSAVGMALLAPDGRFLDVNPALAGMLGRDREHLLGATWREFTHPDDVEGDAQLRLEVLEDRKPSYRLLKRYLRPDGTQVWGDLSVACVRNLDGSVRCLLSQVVDVTEQVEAHEAFRRDQAELIGRLAGGVAHEFNNLVMAINGYAELLAESLPPDDPRRADAEAIAEAGNRAAELARKLLAFGRRQTLLPRALDLCDVVAGLAPALRTLLGGAIEFSARRLGPTCLARGDRALLEEAITHLVLNAREAMPGGGRLDLELSRVSVPDGAPHPPGAPGEYLRLAVKDTGTGIPPDVLPHIFEPFFTTRPFGEARGLGLAGVEGVIAQMGGFVTAESEVGVGSTFALHLPRWVGEALPGRSGLADLPPDAPPLRVLVVDDEPGVRNVTARMLGKLGHSVVEAADPAQALALARDRPFDLLITDVVMPEMDGASLAGQLQALQGPLAVVYISGYSPDRIFEDGLLEEGTPLLTKPFDLLELARRVQEALKRGEATPDAA